jgi:hypothetical protein
MKRFGAILLGLCFFLLPAVVAAQEPTHYTFIAEWTVPRANWADFTANFEKNTRPVLDRRTADGTLVDWGSFENTVHTEEDSTHGVWWTSNTIAGIEKVRTELIKQAANPAMAGAKHRDFFLRSALRNAKAASGSGYLTVSSTVIQPGKGREWRELWNKFTKPVYDQLLADGTILFYAIQVEDVHTQNPGLRFVVSITANAEAEDKVAAGFDADAQKRSAEERRALGAAFADTQVPGSHRDFFARITAMSIK